MKNATQIELGRERIVLADGLQPFLLKTGSGALVAQSQASFPPRFVQPERNAFPGIPTTVVSRDGGQTWQRWKYEGQSGYGPTLEGCWTQLRDGPIVIVEWIADGPSSSGMWFSKLWESHDDFNTIEGPKPITILLPQARCGFDDGGHPYGGLTFHRTLLEQPNGVLLATAYGWFEGDTEPCPYRPSMSKFRCILLRSENKGHSWNYVSTIAVDPAVGEEGFNEPVMVHLRGPAHPGRLLCIMRTGCFSCSLFSSFSDDDGATWSTPAAMPFCGVDPDLIETSDGTVVCSFGWRTHDWNVEPPPAEHGIYLITSRDGGDTWAEPTRVPIDEHAGVVHTTGYTALREIGPRQLLLLYDVGSWSEPVRFLASRNVKLSLDDQPLRSPGSRRPVAQPRTSGAAFSGVTPSPAH